MTIPAPFNWESSSEYVTRALYCYFIRRMGSQGNKAYRFSDEQTAYFLANFHTGQMTGRQLDAEIEASKMSESVALMV